MLKFLERLIVTLKLFLRGKRKIKEISSNMENYSKLKEYGLKFWDAADGYVLTEGTTILLKIKYDLEIFNSKIADKIYIKGYDGDGLSLYEITNKKILASLPEDELEVNEIKLLLHKEGMSFNILKNRGFLILSSCDKHIIFNYVYNMIIQETEGRCVYLDEINVFLIEDKPDEWYRIWTQIASEEGLLINIDRTAIFLEELLNDKLEYQVNGKK